MGCVPVSHYHHFFFIQRGVVTQTLTVGIVKNIGHYLTTPREQKTPGGLKHRHYLLGLLVGCNSALH